MLNIKQTLKQTVHLQMENFGSAMSEALLREFFDAKYHDVILKTGIDKLETGCHQLVLGLSSNFLRNILLASNPGRIPVIILPDVKSSVINYVLLYMYKGEVEVPPDLYHDFVEACELLDIKISLNSEEMDAIVNVPTLRILEGTEEGELLQDDTFLYDDQDTDIDCEMSQGPPNENLYAARSSQLIFGRIKDSTKISITVEESENLSKRLKTMLKCVYKSCNYGGFEEQISANIEATKLVIYKEKLIKAEHPCGFCNAIVPITYQLNKRSGLFQSWINSSLRKHLDKAHQFRSQMNKFSELYKANPNE